MAAKKKSADDKKNVPVSIKVTRAVEKEITALASAHGYEDNRSKFIELAARGLLVVDRSKLEGGT